MSNWRVFLNKSQDALNLSMASSMGKRRYTPKKKKDEQIESAIRLNNLSLSKMHDSVMSGDENPTQKQKQRLKSFNILESRLKQTSSQKNLHNFPLLNKQSSDLQEVVEPLSKKLYSKIKNDSKINEGKNSNTPFQYFCQKQIMSMKKQFQNFQQIVLKQLKKQQKYLNQMIEQITNRLKQGTIEQFQINKIDSISSIKKQFSEQTKPLIDKLNSFAETNKNKIPKLEFQPILTDLNDDFIKKNGKYSFKKFFDAMNHLKKQMKDLNKLSDIHSPRSARSHGNNNLANGNLKQIENDQ